jgi:hypothetical protein
MDIFRLFVITTFMIYHRVCKLVEQERSSSLRVCSGVRVA